MRNKPHGRTRYRHGALAQQARTVFMTVRRCRDQLDLAWTRVRRFPPARAIQWRSHVQRRQWRFEGGARFLQAARRSRAGHGAADMWGPPDTAEPVSRRVHTVPALASMVAAAKVEGMGGRGQVHGRGHLGEPSVGLLDVLVHPLMWCAARRSEPLRPRGPRNSADPSTQTKTRLASSTRQGAPPWTRVGREVHRAPRGEKKIGSSPRHVPSVIERQSHHRTACPSIVASTVRTTTFEWRTMTPTIAAPPPSWGLGL